MSNKKIIHITNDLIPIEDSQKLAAQFVKTVSEQKVTESIPIVEQEQQAGITDLESRLGVAGQKFFEEQRPFIERGLAARGLLRSGSLPESFARQLGQLSTAREAIIAPLRYEAKSGMLKQSLQNTLRGALESGQNLAQALNFARTQLSAGREKAFTGEQARLGREFQGDMFRQQQSLQLALAGAGGGGGAWDDFLQYGLPVLGQFGGGALAGGFSRGFLGKQPGKG